MKEVEEVEEVEVEIFTGKLSLIWLVTTKSEFATEYGNRIVTNQNAALDRRGGQDKSTGAKGEVGSPMPGFVLGLKVNVGDEIVAAEIFLKCGKSIVGSGVCACVF